MKHIKTFIKILLVVGVITYMLSANVIIVPSPDIIFTKYTAIILLTICLAITIHNFGWWLLLSSQKYNITYVKSLLIYCYGTFFNIVMPGGVGGDAARFLYLYRHIKPEEKSAALFTVLISRILGFHALITLCIIIGLFYLEKILNSNALLAIYIIILTIFSSLIVISIIYLLFSKYVLSYLGTIKNSKLKYAVDFILLIIKNIQNYKSKMKYIFLCWIISLLSHIIFISIFYVMSIQLDMNYIDFFENIVVGGLSYMSNSVPITPGGIGVGEGSYNYFYKLFLDNPEYNNLAFGSVFFIAYRVLYTFICILCGLSFIILGKPNTKFTNDGYKKF